MVKILASKLSYELQRLAWPQLQLRRLRGSASPTYPPAHPPTMNSSAAAITLCTILVRMPR